MLKEHSMLDNAGESGEAKEDDRSPARRDTLKAYIAGVTKYPMLTREEEREVARAIYKYKDLGHNIKIKGFLSP